MKNKMNLIIVLVLTVLMGACGRGSQGERGANGTPGLPGAPGNDGHDGAPAQPCSVVAVPVNSNAPAGGSLINCPDGTSSLVLNGTNGTNGHDGQNGTNGQNGQDGQNGHDGTNGTNGTVVSSVQFCPGTVSYPSTFPEVGFVIGGQLYAVYSANGGFLTYIPPGTYSSNGINNSCTFTVHSDGSITH